MGYRSAVETESDLSLSQRPHRPSMRSDGIIRDNAPDEVRIIDLPPHYPIQSAIQGREEAARHRRVGPRLGYFGVVARLPLTISGQDNRPKLADQNTDQQTRAA